MTSQAVRALFVAYVAATAIHIGWVIAHEPFVFDAWNMAVDTHAQPFSVGRFGDYWWFEYTHSNPRIGQALTYLAYKLEYFSVIVTPIAYLAIALGAFVIGTTRWPRWRNGRDLALVAIAIGFIWFGLPQIGKTLFNRAYGANYLYGLAIQLWFLVPLRLRTDGQGTPREAIAYGVAGMIAGMCNEHTGPTLCAFMLAYTWWAYRKTQRKPLLAGGGAVGACIGFAIIFFAPGQGERYEGLAQKVSLTGRVLGRGVTGNLDILRELLLAAAPLLVAIVVVVALARERPRFRMLAIVAIAAVAMAVTVFASPKLGPRFYYASMALVLAAFIGFADALVGRRALAIGVTLAVASSTYAAVHTIPLYARVARAGKARMAALAASKPGSVFVADAFEQVEDSWWFLGDDFRDARKRDMVAKYFGLAGVQFRAYDPNAPLGVAGVKLVPHAVLESGGCLDGGLALGAFKGFDLEALHREMKMAIELLPERPRLRELELAVVLDDPRIHLPRARVLVGRRWPDRFEGYVAKIERKGRARQRDVVIPRELGDTQVYVYQVGGELRELGNARAPLHYVPWKTGVYWVLACRPDECFVVAATRQAG